MGIQGFTKKKDDSTVLNNLKNSCSEKEIFIATGYFRTAYKNVEHSVVMTDALIEQLKISALLKVERLRSI